MVFLLINPAANHECQYRICCCKKMKLQRRNGCFNHYLAEVPNIQVDWIEQKQILSKLREAPDVIKDRRHIHQEHGKDAVQILNIPEKQIQRRQNQSHAQIEYNQANDRVQQKDKLPRNGNPIDHHKNKIDDQRETEVDQ